MKILSLLFMLILIFFGISFAILNARFVTLNYYFGHSEVSLSLLLVLTMSFGALIGFLLATPSIFRLKRAQSRLKSRIKQAELEVENLRSIPIRNSH